MQASSDSFDDVTQPLAANRLEQQRSLASADVLETNIYDSMKLDKLRLCCGTAHDNCIKTRSRGIDGQLVSKAKKDLILELKNADTMRLTTGKISKFFKPLAGIAAFVSRSTSSSSQRIAQPLARKKYGQMSQKLLRDACKRTVVLRNTDGKWKRNAQLVVELKESDAKDARIPVDVATAAPAGRSVGDLATLFSKQSLAGSASASSNDIAQPLVSNTNDYDSAHLASDEDLVAEK